MILILKTRKGVEVFHNPSPNKFMSAVYQLLHEGGGILHYGDDKIQSNSMSGDVSEQSVILNKMDELTDFPQKLKDFETKYCTDIRNVPGLGNDFIITINASNMENYDGIRRKYFEHDEQAFITHPYPSDLI